MSEWATWDVSPWALQKTVVKKWNFFFPFIFISWRLITLQYCSGFCHTLTWISHGYTCISHPDPPSHLPLHPIPLGLSSAPGPSTCFMHPTWAGDLFHPTTHLESLTLHIHHSCLLKFSFSQFLPLLPGFYCIGHLASEIKSFTFASTLS